VVLGNEKGLNLEDLASGQVNIEVDTATGIRLALFALSTLWILLLITATVPILYTWYLLAVGGFGMVQNIYVASWERKLENFGVELEVVGVYGYAKVMNTLFALEEAYSHLGRGVRDEFSLGKLRDDEKDRWNAMERRAAS
jgi:hypothetical protein